jgi:signal transduction histidine kinase/FixJ family two-component response regulator
MQPRPERLFDCREFPVLYVDDEVSNRRVFEIGFGREFKVLTAEGGEAALRVLAERPVALVLSDQRMPGLSGVELLRRVCELDPRTVRVLVSALGDAAMLRDAINSGSVYRFVPKPWQVEDMRLVLRQGIELYALEREREELLRELTILHQASAAFNKQLDVDTLAELLLRTLTAELGFDGATLFFLDAKGESLRVHGGWPGRAAEGRTPELRACEAGELVARLRRGEGQLLRLDRADELERGVARWITDLAAREVLVVPLIGKEAVIGALAVDNRRGGRRFHVADRTLVEGLAGLAVVAIENARLVDDLRRSREQMLRTDRLGRLGSLAAGLAHEINNPLVSVRTFLSLAPQKRREDDPEFWGAYHALTLGEVDRIRGLVDSMRRLSAETEESAPREPCDPGEVAQAVALLLSGEASKARLEIEIERHPATPRVLAVRNQLHQVLINLLLNAIHATPPEGRVVVRTGPDPEARQPAVCIEVQDSGRGIPEEDLERIFEPFYTTKGPDQGTGLGLMICHRLVANHGGEIEVRSRVGEGTTLRVRLPALEPGA